MRRVLPVFVRVSWIIWCGFGQSSFVWSGFDGRRHAGMEHWLPLFHERMETLFDYVVAPILSFDFQSEQSRGERLVQIEGFHQARMTLFWPFKIPVNKKEWQWCFVDGVAYHPLPPKKLYLSDDEFLIWCGYNPADPFCFFLSRKLMICRMRGGGIFADVRALSEEHLFDEVGKYFASLQKDGRKIWWRVIRKDHVTGWRWWEEGGQVSPHPVDSCIRFHDWKSGQVGRSCCILNTDLWRMIWQSWPSRIIWRSVVAQVRTQT